MTLSWVALFFLARTVHCASPYVTLQNFKPLPLFLQLDQNFTTKHQYWSFLANTYGYRSGLQLNATSPGALCPVPREGAMLALPSCLERTHDMRYAVFIGDSLTREAAWSFARLAAADGREACQQSGGDHARWHNTHNDPSFSCEVTSAADGAAICGADAQLLPGSRRSGDNRGTNGNVTDCCAPRRFSMYFHSFGFDEDDVHDTFEHYRVNCPCPSLLFMNLDGMHRLLGEAAQTSADDPPAPWSFPFGRPTGLRLLLAAATPAVLLLRKNGPNGIMFAPPHAPCCFCCA
jgi:hypothetical protein